MKLMKHITIALLLCAIPAMAVAQTTVTCDACTHVVSVYHGHGGFIATAAKDAKQVSWVASCNGVTRSGQLMPNADGMVSALLSDDLACDPVDEKKPGSFELGPIMDGGWYWLTMEGNSAIGGLVNKDVLKNKNMVMPTDAGDSVNEVDGQGAVLLQHTSGHVGILPTILPVMDMEPDEVMPCGVKGAGTSSSPYTVRKSDCMLGDGKAMILATTYNGYTGKTDRVMNGDTVTRPAGTGTVTITIDLWGNGTGHFITDSSSPGTNGVELARGIGAVGSLSPTNRAATRYQGVNYSVSVGGGAAGGSEVSAGTAKEGVDRTATTNHAVDVTIVSSDANCKGKTPFATPVTVTATVASGDQTQVTPSIAVRPGGVAAELKFTVVCPPASANMGRELVPENPFPTE